MNILIIKHDYNDFEKFFSEHMKRTNVDVVEPYKKTNFFSHYILAISKRLNIIFLHSLFIENWKFSLNKYDKIVVFDNSAPYILKWLRKKVKKDRIYFYFWNIPSFDYTKYSNYANFIIFDQNYADKHDMLFLHQFYFLDVILNNNTVKFDCFYVGYDKNRYSLLAELAKCFIKKIIKYKFVLVNNLFKNTIDKYSIELSNSYFPYTYVLNNISLSKSILELVTNNQSGLTLRTLESLFFNKKLITNNINIKNFDFYNKNNIFVIGVDTNLTEFLNLPYIKINNYIKNKYSYDHWLNEMYQL